MAAKLDPCVLCFGYCQGFFLFGVAFWESMDTEVVLVAVPYNIAWLNIHAPIPNANYFLGTILFTNLREITLYINHECGQYLSNTLA